MKKNILVIASHNVGKISEIRDMLNKYKLNLKISSDFNIEEPDEDGKTFEENALLKSKLTSEKSGFLAISDDSGLCIKSLNGEPGIYSSRLAGKKKNFKLAMEKLNKRLSIHKDKSCKFVCALSLCWPNGENITVRGEIHGTFTWPPKGKKGFGYDPIFLPEGFQNTFGEIDPEIKHSISHRKVAFDKLLEKLLTKSQKNIFVCE